MVLAPALTLCSEPDWGAPAPARGLPGGGEGLRASGGGDRFSDARYGVDKGAGAGFDLRLGNHTNFNGTFPTLLILQ